MILRKLFVAALILVLGGPATFLMAWTSGKFAEANPKTYAAFVAALEEAMRSINNNKRAAIEA